VLLTLAPGTALAQNHVVEPGGVASDASGPISRAVVMEAARLAALAPPPAEPTRETPDQDWSRVRKLTPGTEIIVIVRAEEPGTRYFIAADESGATLLNVPALLLPKAAARELIDIASSHPDAFAPGRSNFVGGSVRAGDDGVFVAGRKVAEFGQVVQRIARSDISEIRAATKVRKGYPVGGALLGALGGAFAGPLIGAFLQPACQCDDPGLAGAMFGLIAGPIAFGTWGYFAMSHLEDSVIYSTH
jgi:hypothetical protein